MCGITGIFSQAGRPPDQATVHRMCQSIVHRGPDDEGIYVKGNVGLGMRRLSIIDVAGGHQPIHNEDRTVWVVFNGEIYNFLELRASLEKRGHRFYTHTDTEVIAHLYEEQGADCVQQLRGMFALAVYDERKQSLLLARDRLGKKPLHYAVADGRLLFGSEIKAILAAAPELAQVDQEGLLYFFYFNYIPDPFTAFTAIRKLPPGHLLEFKNGQAQVRQYWDLPTFGRVDPGSDEECFEELEHRLMEATRMRMISDVPLGALLSGGVDSSLVVALMARAGSGPVKTFSIGFRNADFNEAPYARQVAEKFGTAHHELIVTPDVRGTLEYLTHMLEEPFGDSSMLPTYYVSCLAREHVTVALSGDGGDELFAGYDRYWAALRSGFSEKIPSWAGRFYRESIYPHLPRGLYGRRFSYNFTLPQREKYIDGLCFQLMDPADRSIFSGDFLASAKTRASPVELFRNYFDRAPAPDPLSRMQYLDLKTYLPGDVLCKVDRMSMATSLEVRSPLLDHVFVEWAVSLAPRWRMRLGQPKYALKKVAERLGVPAAVLYRPKQGFALPLVHWFREQLRDQLPELLLDSRAVQRGYFDTQAVRRILDEHSKGRFDHSALIWQLVIFELWHRNFLPSVGDDSYCTGAGISGAGLLKQYASSGTTERI
jgi:asparagine synthase (glutamine-hydrolysing)